MKQIIILTISIWCYYSSVAQNNNLQNGKYIFSGDKYFECMDLQENGTFFYKIDQEFVVALINLYFDVYLYLLFSYFPV